MTEYSLDRLMTDEQVDRTSREQANMVRLVHKKGIEGINPDHIAQVFTAENRGQVIQSLFMTPPTIPIGDENIPFTPHITSPSADITELAHRSITHDPDLHSAAFLINILGDYALKPDISSDDDTNQWRTEISHTLSRIDEYFQYDKETSYEQAFKDHIKTVQSYNEISMAFELLGGHVQWSDELNQNHKTLITSLRKNQTKLAQKAADSLAIDALKYLDNQSQSWAISERINLAETPLPQVLDKLMYRLDFSDKSGKSIIKKEDLKPTARACVEKLGAVAAKSPQTILMLISTELPGIMVTDDEGQIEMLRPVPNRIPPSQSELKTASLLQVAQLSDDQKTLANPLVRFLKAPRINDGFDERHDERTRWESAMGKALALITTEARSQLSEEDHAEFPQLDQVFNDDWIYNKYTKNNRLKVMWGIQNTARSLNEDDPRRSTLAILLERFNAEGFSNQYLDNDAPVDVDAIADTLSDISQCALYIFANKEIPANLTYLLE